MLAPCHLGPRIDRYRAKILAPAIRAARYRRKISFSKSKSYACVFDSVSLHGTHHVHAAIQHLTRLVLSAAVVNQAK